MVDGYTRRPSSSLDIQTVGIVSLDVGSQFARGLTRERHELRIDLRYPVGSVYETPVVGEQWYVQRMNGVWRLNSRIPFNDPTDRIDPVEGQTKIGNASGPTEISGTVMNLHGPLNLSSTRPSDPNLGDAVYDQALKKPIWWNGDEWTDALGDPV